MTHHRYQPMTIKPALCLDLDGTVRYSKNGEFINGAGDVAVFPDVEDKLWEFRGKGFLVLGISNQGGVAFGHKSIFDAEEELDVMFLQFKANPFHLVKCSFHHPDGSIHPYNTRSLTRKPDIGLLALCEMELFQEGCVIDWDNSLFVGDRPEDELCAENAGIDFIHANEFFGRNAS